MNYCRKCQSDYEKPGTCNCFAPSQTFTPSPVYVPWPTYPQPPYVPFVPWYTTTTPTWTITGGSTVDTASGFITPTS